MKVRSIALADLHKCRCRSEIRGLSQAMSAINTAEKLDQDALRRRLADILAVSDDEQFVRAIWGLRAIQSRRSEAGLKVLSNVPLEAITPHLYDPLAIYPWELETLANELLATPKRGHFRLFDLSRWPHPLQLAGLLRAVEQADGNVHRSKVPIMRELYRIQGRQFEWQRPVFWKPQFYRNAFIYGQGQSAAFFSERFGISIADMMYVGFALSASFLADPVHDRRQNLDWMNIPRATLDQVLSMISAPLTQVRRQSARDRTSALEIAYRPSVLRNFPCIAFGARGHRLRAPLPELITWRTTSGLFYDLIDAGGPVRADYGRRFEEYAKQYFAAMLPQLNQVPEWRYGPAKRSVDTPDFMLLASDSDDIEIAVECKATRMSLQARFGEKAEEERGYDDMVKGICQLWRFFSHCRRGRTGRVVAEDAVGVVLTLENWFVMGAPQLAEIEARALERSKTDPEIEEQDRRSVIFCPMPDLEEVLTRATPATFRAAIKLASGERKGWLLSLVHQDIRDPSTPAKPFPFDEQFSELLPWWGRLGKAVFA